MYRGIIVLFMLEGHVLRVLLTPDIKATQFFALHEIFHGVTAPGFLFGAGFTFAITAQRRWEQAVSFSYGFLRRMWRAIFLIAIGYILHIPFLSLQKMISAATLSQWNSFLLFDVLQCIGVCLLLMRFLLILIKEERVFIPTLVMLLFTIVYTTPLLWAPYFQQSLSLPIISAINGLTGSPFPLFPFSGFLISGACVSWLFLRAAQNKQEVIFIKSIIIVGISLMIVGFLLDTLPFRTYDQYLFWNTSPNYFWIRLGALLLMLGTLWYIEDFFATYKGSVAYMPKWLTVLGIESLFVYIVHLLILYGWVTNVEWNLSFWCGGNLNIIESSLIFLALTLVMIPCSLAWRYIKKKHHILLNYILWWMGLCIGWSFLFNPY